MDIEKEVRPSVLTVTEFTRSVKDLIEAGIGYVAVKGEVSNFRKQFSGHCYFTLKDEKAQLQTVMFRRDASRLRFALEDGLEVVAMGRATVYEARGQYQLITEMIEPAGLGALQLAFEQLKKKLEEEGLFDPARKRALPPFPRRIGIVTSPTGAALRDFLHVIRRRFRGVSIVVYPAPVQGPEAPRALRAGIQAFDDMADVDVIVLARGGGSMEDLWAFNDESVARAIARTRKPVVTGIGHETDFTIADFVADLRAPTPSAAAELVVANRVEVAFRLRSAAERLVVAARGIVEDLRNRLVYDTKALRDPAARVGEYRLKMDDLSSRVFRSFKNGMENRGNILRRLSAHLDALSPLKTLDRGYAVALTVPEHRVIRDAHDIAAGETLLLRLSRGSLYCKVTGRDATQFLPFAEESELPDRG